MTIKGKQSGKVKARAVNAGAARDPAATPDAVTDTEGSGAPFWKRKSLQALDAREWESLCDGCGRCCLVKLEDDDTGDIYTTDVACRLLDGGTCRCTDYPNRFSRVSDCLRIDLEAVENLSWLPPTCAYRLVFEGHDLYWWHHLVSGSRDTVHTAGISVRGRTLSEDDVAVEDLPERIVDWPMEG